MKLILNISLIIVLFGIMSCNAPDTRETKVDAAVDNLDWLLGNWQRVDEVEGKRTYETWFKSKSGDYLGHGITLLNIDTVFEENMKIYKPDNEWVLEVSGVNEEPTVFAFTEKSNNSFASYCAENEFPKKIEYFKEEGFLNAVISDDITKVPFKFRKVESSL